MSADRVVVLIAFVALFALLHPDPDRRAEAVKILDRLLSVLPWGKLRTDGDGMIGRTTPEWAEAHGIEVNQRGAIMSRSMRRHKSASTHRHVSVVRVFVTPRRR
jgi:hypothetical protein